MLVSIQHCYMIISKEFEISSQVGKPLYHCRRTRKQHGKYDIPVCFMRKLTSDLCGAIRRCFSLQKRLLLLCLEFKQLINHVN